MTSNIPMHTSTHTLARRAPILAAAASLLAFTSCRPNAAQPSAGDRSPSAPANEAAAATERVAKITKYISQRGKLPGALLDAQFVEEKVGDGVLGPSDLFAFYALTVPVADLPAWRAALTSSPVLNGPAKYAAPKAPTTWWLKSEEFSKLELFGAKPLTGLVNGWVGLAPDGRVFIYAFKN